MTAAEIIYEQYKKLQKKARTELTELIMEDSDKYVQVSLPNLIEGLKELTMVLNGNVKPRPIKELLKELS